MAVTLNNSEERLLTLKEVRALYFDGSSGAAGKDNEAVEAAIEYAYRSHPEVFTTASTDGSGLYAKKVKSVLDAVTMAYTPQYNNGREGLGEEQAEKYLESYSRDVAEATDESSFERRLRFQEEHEKYDTYYDESEEVLSTSEMHETWDRQQKEFDEQLAKDEQEQAERERKEAEEQALAEENNAQQTEAEQKANEENERIQSMRKEIESIRHEIINKNLDESSIVDITNNFAWMDTDILSPSSFERLDNKIPSVFAIEYEQTVSSAISNIINTINIGLNSIKQTVETADSLIKSQLGGNYGISGWMPQAKDNEAGDTSLFSRLSNFARNKLAAGNISDSTTLLAPYKYLYATKATGKRFVFPYFEDTVFPSVTNTWGDSSGDEGSILLNNPIINFIKSAAGAGAALATDISNLAALKNGGAGNAQNIMEMAKSFKYDTNGPEITVNFTLFNTVIKNNSRAMWKKHFKFLYLFAVRNMAWKISPSAFLPPLLYDVIIPGQKRLPLSYVSGVKVQSKGVIRKLKMQNFISSDTNDISVNVPEAWQVTVTFKSLIGDNANLFVSGIRDLKISTN